MSSGMRALRAAEQMAAGVFRLELFFFADGFLVAIT